MIRAFQHRCVRADAWNWVSFARGTVQQVNWVFSSRAQRRRYMKGSVRIGVGYPSAHTARILRERYRRGFLT